jgi:serine/threonine-protein kinase SMG1
LRIVKLIVKYAIGLKDELEKGLSKTPVRPWRNIIPQLFCRLNHPETYVRQSIINLLHRVSSDYPHLIIYPAVVGSEDGPTKIEEISSSTGKKKKNIQLSNFSIDDQDQDDFLNNNDDDGVSPELLDDCNDEQNQDLYDNENEFEENGVEDENEFENEKDEAFEESKVLCSEKKMELKMSYKYLVDILGENNPRTIAEVKLFVHEMRRITLLREELWLGTLNQIQSDINSRLDQLTLEIDKVNANIHLSDQLKSSTICEKYEIILKPIVSCLEHVYEMTSKMLSETPNEESFQAEFSQKIDKALIQLKNVKNANKPSQGWSSFKLLHQSLLQRSQRRDASDLAMNKISPKLAMIKGSTIPIPGNDGQHITIHSISPNVIILPTKTKPKKLFFIGSNGVKYPYLLKVSSILILK